MNSHWHTRKQRKFGGIGLMLLMLSLWLLSGCQSKSIVCQPPEVPAWMMEPVPLSLDLQNPLLKALQE